MKLLIDDANIETIKKFYDCYPIDGVTTNPTILSRNGERPFDALKKIRDFIGMDDELHVQVISTTYDKIVEEGKKITEALGMKTFIKIPTIPEGLKAMQILSKEGYKITATSIYTPMQAYLAAKAGADYTAPYINRMDDFGINGVLSAKSIQDIFTVHNFKTQVLAASFKNSLQVQELCTYGIGAATLAPNVIENLIKNACVTSAVNDFVNDFESLCGKDTTMLTCEE